MVVTGRRESNHKGETCVLHCSWSMSGDSKVAAANMQRSSLKARSCDVTTPPCRVMRPRPQFSYIGPNNTLAVIPRLKNCRLTSSNFQAPVGQTCVGPHRARLSETNQHVPTRSIALCDIQGGAVLRIPVSSRGRTGQATRDDVVAPSLYLLI